MQIVIDIPEYDYEHIKEIYEHSHIVEATYSYIYHGTPLPKGHGRLIDANEFEEFFGKECVGDCGACMPKRKTDGKGRWYYTCPLIDISPTIIEAERSEECR